VRWQLARVTIAQDGKALIASDDDQMIKFWDIQTGQCFRTFQGYGSGVWAIAISPPNDSSNYQILASNGEEQTVKLWDINTGTVLNRTVLGCGENKKALRKRNAGRYFVKHS
jgi:WD40 repeat protein